MECGLVGAYYLLIKSIIHMLLIIYLCLNMACRTSKAHWRRVHVTGTRTVPFVIYVVLAMIHFIWSIIIFVGIKDNRDDLKHLPLSTIMIIWAVIFLAFEVAYMLSWAINLRDINWAMLIYILLLVGILIYSALNIFMINCVAQELMKKHDK